MISQDNVLRGEDIEWNTNGGLVPKMFNNLRKATQDIFTVNVDTEEEITYEQLWHKTIRVASALQSLGLGFGKVVAIIGENNLEVYSVYFGATFTGACAGCVNPTLTASEMAQILNLLRPDFVFCTQDRISVTELALKEVENSPILIIPDGTAPCLNYNDLLTHDPDAFVLPQMESWDEHVVGIFFSSGTTGLPKGAKVRDKGLQFFHDRVIPSHLKRRFTQFPLCAGSSVIFMTSTMRDMGIFICGGKTNGLVISTLKKYKPNYWFNSPANLLKLAQEPGINYEDLSSIEYMFSSGAGLTTEQIVQLNKTLFNNRIGVINSYNNIEALAISIWPNNSDIINSPKIGSVGKLQPLVQLKIISTDTREKLGPGQEGEMYVKTPSVMAGYINCPKETAEALDADGWYKTGDIGYYDEDGYVYISGRVKEIFKCMNRQVSPMQLEAIILEHPSVEEAGVAGKPHPVDGNHPTAFVVLKKDAPPVAEDELVKYVNDKVADYRKLYGGVYFVDQLPKTPSGKIVRGRLFKTFFP